MDINYLYTLKAILDTGSFQNAANRLGYTQSTISFQVRQLEQAFSVRLFEKVGRRMVLTQAGKEVLPHVNSILASWQDIQNYGSQTRELAGDLHVAMPESLLVYKMQPVLAAFRKQAPNVNLSLHSYNCYTINNYVVNGEVDIGIQYDIEGYTGHIETDDLEKLSLALVGAAELPETPLAETLAAANLIVSNDPEDACRVIITEYLKRENLSPRGLTELGSIETVKRSVVNNLGVAYLPEHVVEEELRAGRLKKIDSGVTGKVVTVICAYHKNKWVSPAMELFIRLAKGLEAGDRSGPQPLDRAVPLR